MPDANTLKAAADVGGWVFATVSISVGSAWIIRWLLRQNEALSASLDRVTAALTSLTEEVRASRGRR